MYDDREQLATYVQRLQEIIPAEDLYRMMDIVRSPADREYDYYRAWCHQMMRYPMSKSAYTALIGVSLV